MSDEKFKIKNGVLTSYLDKDAETACVYIPSDVVSIGKEAFDGSKMKSVRFLGDTVSIGEGAFMFCDNLESIVFPESLREIGEKAFQGCRKLSKIRVPGGVKEIKSATFRACGSPSLIELSEGVESLGPIFSALSRPAKVSLPKSLKRIDPDAFGFMNGEAEVTLADGCEAFKMTDGCLYTRDGKTLLFVSRTIEEVNVPEGVETIEDYALNSCDSLVSVRLPRTLTSIGAGAFRLCSSLSDLNIPDGVTYIGGKAFSECSSLESVSVPNGVTRIAKGTFGYCEHLVSVHLPAGLKSIGEEAFTNCRALSSVTIPAAVEEIGEGAFVPCGSLKEAVFLDPFGWTYVPADAKNGERADVDSNIAGTPKRAAYHLRVKWKGGISKKKKSRMDNGWRRLK